MAGHGLEKEESNLTNSDFSDNRSRLGYCYCGNIDGHEWAPNSLCFPNQDESSVVSLNLSQDTLRSEETGGDRFCFQEQQQQATVIDSQESNLSKSLFSDLSNSTVEDCTQQQQLSFTDIQDSSLSISPFSDIEDNLLKPVCDGSCPTAVKLLERIKFLEAENQWMKEQLQQENKVPGYPDYFNVVYDGDSSVYVYKLLDDYRAGDLCVLVK